MNKIPHILIVDDDQHLLSDYERHLQDEGLQNRSPAQDRGHGLGAARKLQLLTWAMHDLRLGDMSGLIVLRAIKSTRPKRNVFYSQVMPRKV